MTETLCWDCKKAAIGRSSECPWARDFTPVEGWKAKKTFKNYRERRVESYLVKKCPLFEPEEARKAEAEYDISRIKTEVENELVGIHGAERTKARRAALKRRGVCVTCTAALAKSGYASCAKCLNYHAERQKMREWKKHGT